MRIDKTEQIGKVLLKHIWTNHSNAPIYSDGVAEDRLYMKFKNNPNYEQLIDDTRFLSWVQEYHLSPVRQNLLKWFPFNCNGTVLEVGAGCGALTGLLCQKLKKVVALEYSKKRALITAMRHSQRSNLEVIVGGLQDFQNDQKFDYITVIGVLEYAGTYYCSENPHKSFLTKVRDMLKSNGIIILAIENKIGLKYICGAPEDHTGRMFDSIYDYPYPCKVQTFSKKELTDLLHSAGFQSLKWYYPLPDYKMPQEVISDDVTLTNLDSIWGLFPAQTGGCRRKEILSERRFGKTIAEAGLFGEFANSFLVIAETQNTRDRSKCLRFSGANMRRKSDYRINKMVCREGRRKLFIRSADNDKSIEFLHLISDREALAKKYFRNRAAVVTGKLNGNSLIYPYIKFPTLVELVAEEINHDDEDFGRLWIDKYIQFLQQLPVEKCIPDKFMKELEITYSAGIKPLQCFYCGIIDCIPRNIVVDEENEKWYVIDNEFTYDFPVPVDVLIFRAIHTLVIDLQNEIQSRVCRSRPVVIFSGYGLNRHYMPLSWLDILTKMEMPLKQLVHWSSAFQNRVLRDKYKIRLRLKTRARVFKNVPISEITINRGIKERVYQVLRKGKRLLK
jgi:2-polyprenyl-3-methyl-5-hydroxy-6-metoxy-1,4-benzoquinol methylase